MPIAEIQTPDGRVVELEVPEGATEQQIIDFVSSQDLSGSTTDTDQEKESASFIAEKPGEFIRQLLEFGGLAVGGIAGASSPVPGGAVVGSGLGFAGGKQLADRLEEFIGTRERTSLTDNLEQVAPDFAEGVALEAGGQIAGKLLIEPAINLLKEPIGRALSFIGEKVEGLPIIKQVSKGVRSLSTSLSPIKRAEVKLRRTGFDPGRLAANISEAEALEKDIDGLMFTRAERSGVPTDILLEQHAKRTGSTEFSNTIDGLKEQSNLSIQRHFKKAVSGDETIQPAIEELSRKQAQLEQARQIALNNIEGESRLLLETPDLSSSGKSARDVIRKSKEAAKIRAGELYGTVPDVEIDTKILRKTLDEVEAGFNPNTEEASTFPKKLVDGLRREIEPVTTDTGILDASGRPISRTDNNPLSFSELRKERTRVLNAKRKAVAGGDAQLAGRLGRIQGGIEQTINQLNNEKTAAGEAYRRASQFYRENYIEPFKQNTVAQVLKHGRDGATKVRNSQVIGKFFRSGSGAGDFADDFLDALKFATTEEREIARQAVSDYAIQDLLKSSTDDSGRIVGSKLNKWLNKHKVAIDKFDIRDRFANIKRLQGELDLAQANVDSFSRLSARKMLGVDPSIAVDEMMKGEFSRNPVKAIGELFKLVDGNPHAKSGIKNAFVDRIIEKAGMGGEKLTISNVKSLNKLIKENSSALRFMYKDDPSKLKSLIKVQKAYQRLASTLQGQSGNIDGVTDTLFKKSIPAASLHFTRSLAVLNAIRNGTGGILNIPKNQAEAIVNRAILDPEFAATIDMKLNSKTVKAINNRMRNHLLTLGFFFNKKDDLIESSSENIAP